MPLLYGERSKAFQRLQHEIIRNSDDESVFAWTTKDPEVVGSDMLAESPLEYIDCGDMENTDRPVRGSRAAIQRRPYAMTNKGLSFEIVSPSDMHVELQTGIAQAPPYQYFAPINCARRDAPWSLIVLFFIHQRPLDRTSPIFRVQLTNLCRAHFNPGNAASHWSESFIIKSRAKDGRMRRSTDYQKIYPILPVSPQYASRKSDFTDAWKKSQSDGKDNVLCTQTEIQRPQ